jgi:hypothetical protein
MPVILATWEAEVRSIEGQGQPRQIIPETFIFKINRAKWTGGVAQAKECLVCELKALSSNPSPTKKKNQFL